jgi:iron complex transport system permease protein
MRVAPVLAGALILLFAAVLLALALGSYPVTPGMLVSLLWAKLRLLPDSTTAATVIFAIRGPRIIGSLMGSGVALMKFLADPENQLPAITFWLLGSLAAFNRSDLLAIAMPVAVALLPLILLRWQLDVMTLGDEEATALGVRVRLVRISIVAAATLMTAAAVSVSGIVGWVGLVVPHIARLIVGPSFTPLLPTAAVIGTPVFLVLLARGSRGWN